jgi:hypothetical protein
MGTYRSRTGTKCTGADFVAAKPSPEFLLVASSTAALGALGVCVVVVAVLRMGVCAYVMSCVVVE